MKLNVFDWVKNKWKQNIINKLIIINVAVFIFTSIAGLLTLGCAGGSCSQMSGLSKFLALPMNATELLYSPWTLLTHMFTHSGIMHIAFNMITLYFAGGLFLTFFSERKLLSLYMVGGIFAALLTVLLYSVIPALGAAGYAVGASAAIMAVLIAVCVYAPNMSVNLMFLGEVKLKWIGIVLVVIDFISMPESNTGGHIAHLSGALFGFLFAWQMKHGTDILKIFNKRVKQVKTKAKTYVNKETLVNQVLDKISKKGMNSLTDSEREILTEYNRSW